jgi:penicillin-binding protein 2
VHERNRTWRAQVLVLLSGVSFAGVAVTLFSLQVLQYGEFDAAAKMNRQDTYRVVAPRGITADRSGHKLAENVYQARLTYPRRLLVGSEPDSTLERFAQLLDLDAATLQQRIEASNEPERVTLVRRATAEQVAVVEEHRLLLPQVQATIGPRRSYPLGSLAAHILGYLGEVRREETESDEHYRAGDMIGRMGIERAAELLLRGAHGVRGVEVNAAGHIVGEVQELSEEPLAGSRLFLTLDYRLQGRVEELLRGQVGACVVMEVRTGDLLAVASSPTYDPNEFMAGITADRMNEILNDPHKRMFNRAFRGAYPPGSPFKLITAAAALERNKVTPSTRFQPCYGSYPFGDRVFRCWELGGHGSLDLEGAIVQSCDVYFYQLAQELTIDELAETARSFGLGRGTEVRFFTDASGLVPDSEWYDGAFGPRGWSVGVKLNLAIGQGELLATPLQMARAFSAIGGDGYLYRPHTALVTESAYGNRDTRRVVRSQEPVSSERVRKFLKRALRGVVAEERGTGGLARVAGIEISGKTGTSENSAGEDHAWFVAYAPSRDPDIAVALIVENAGHGGEIAAPLVREVLEAYFHLRRGEPISPLEESR